MEIEARGAILSLNTRTMRAMLTYPEVTVIGIIVVLLALIVFTRLRIDIIALLVLLMVALTQLVPANDVLSGFSSSVVITIIGLLVITRGLEQTGVMQWVARQLQAFGRGSEAKLIALVMSAGAAVSLLMNNVAAGAVLLPAVLQVSRDGGVAASKLMIPTRIRRNCRRHGDVFHNCQYIDE